MNESKTPRTDALIMKGPLAGPRDWIAFWDMAVDAHRELESDLAAAQELIRTREMGMQDTIALHAKQVAALTAERDALAARVEQAEASRWQPIETCPESCRGEYPNYVLFYNGHHIGVGFCYPSEDDDDGTLYADETDQIVTPRPTHWMPPPLPPGNDTAIQEATP